MKAGDFDAASYLWETLPKKPDAEHITYTDADVEALWHLGYVDTELYPLDTWMNAWAPYQQSDHSYVLSEAEFTSLDRFRYKGELYAPFDPALINEGQYTDEGFQELIDASVAPSCAYPRAELHLKVEELKSQIRLGNGLLDVTLLAKRELATWLTECPSPLRRLELIMLATFNQQLAHLQQSGQSPASPQQLAQVEASTFSMLSSQSIEAQALGLKAVQKAKTVPAAPIADAAATPAGPRLKDVRRSRRGVKM